MQLKFKSTKVIDVLVDIGRRDVIRQLDETDEKNYVQVFSKTNVDGLENWVSDSHTNAVKFTCCLMKYEEQLELVISDDKKKIKAEIEERAVLPDGVMNEIFQAIDDL